MGAHHSGENGAGSRRIRLTFADDGEFHSVLVTIPAERLDAYERLVDVLREDPGVTRQLYVDIRRLVAAVVEED